VSQMFDIEIGPNTGVLAQISERFCFSGICERVCTHGPQSGQIARREITHSVFVLAEAHYYYYNDNVKTTQQQQRNAKQI